MKDFKAAQRIRRKLYSKTVFVILAVITLVLLKGAWGVFQKQQESGKNLARVEKELVTASERQVELEQSVKNLETIQGIEEEIRSRYSVAKPGEEVVLIVDPPVPDDGTLSERGSSWSKIKKWFFGLFRND